MTYTREFLISELHRFIRENGRNPKLNDMRVDLGYPSIRPYFNHFGSFNNALTEAGLEVNHYSARLDGSEVCSNCGVKTPTHWFYINGARVCQSCYDGSKYRYGRLNPASTTGFAFISQRIAAKVLGLSIENDCNCSIGFGAPHDLYDEADYGYINVKAATLDSSNRWKFHFTNKYVPDTYMLIGFSYGRTDVSHVWILHPLNDIINNRPEICISDADVSLNKVKCYEIDAKLYNDAYHSMSLVNCSVLDNKAVTKVKSLDERVNDVFISHVNKFK